MIQIEYNITRMVQMNKNHTGIAKIISSLCLCLVIWSCNNKSETKKEPDESAKPAAKNLVKPPCSHHDTLTINYPAAVFYQPDSQQLISIKAVTDSLFYESSMHEYFYQMRNAQIVIKKNWPGLTITVVKNYRFLMYIKKDNTREYIDLDTRNDTHGLFVFDGIKSPLPVDMTNLETEISFYLKE